jgi:hypothetical protein
MQRGVGLLAPLIALADRQPLSPPIERRTPHREDASDARSFSGSLGARTFEVDPQFDANVVRRGEWRCLHGATGSPGFPGWWRHRWAALMRCILLWGKAPLGKSHYLAGWKRQRVGTSQGQVRGAIQRPETCGRGRKAPEIPATPSSWSFAFYEIARQLGFSRASVYRAL